MRYVSTRGEAPRMGFADVLLAGLARDGGLYVPDTWPSLAAEDISALAGLAYPRAAHRVLSPFIGSAFAGRTLPDLIDQAYSGFRHTTVAPLVQIAPNEWVMELFHGPTLAFKDVAMQLLARLIDHVLRERGERITIIGATSGDTGAAAIEAFRGLNAVDVVILHPNGRVSPVQRRQMTTVLDANVHNIAVNGTFDDCQAIVKALFNDLEFRDRMALSGVNSINWARVVAQSVYYFTAAAALGAPDRTCAFSVPTGNFGDIYAGYIAERMGLGVERLVLATNVNDILVRTLDTGRYQVGDVVATQSPSMDIQVASNFERFVFEARGRDAEAVRGMMADLKDKGGFSLGDDVQAEAQRVFAAHRVDEAQTVATIAQVYRETGMVVDPHTAVGIAAGRRARASEEVRAGTPLVHLATAHPAKFPDAVEKAVGFRPQLPSWLADLEQREERVTVLDPDPKAIAGFIEAHVAGPAGAAPVGGAA